jgi:hypothetical protein
MTEASRLPTGFGALEPFVAKWAKPTVNERLNARCVSSMEEIRAFYDVAIEHASDILVYLDQFSLDEMPDQAGCLMQLLLALAHASVAVEIQGKPLPTNCRYPLGVFLKNGVSPFG